MKAETLLHDPSLQLSLQPCPLCSGNQFQSLARHDRHHLDLQTAGCLVCGLIQTNPRPSAAGLDAFYALYYRSLYQNVATPDKQYVQRFQKNLHLSATAEYLLNALSLEGNGRLLDYGCGEGSLFVALREAAVRTVGKVVALGRKWLQ
ncbi:MAG: hypothetical protein Q7J29_01615 [Stagnimonas sp.]|nr:hypothetical protein [Stagnimonas sp.]